MEIGDNTATTSEFPMGFLYRTELPLKLAMRCAVSESLYGCG